MQPNLKFNTNVYPCISQHCNLTSSKNIFTHLKSHQFSLKICLLNVLRVVLHKYPKIREKMKAAILGCRALIHQRIATKSKYTFSFPPTNLVLHFFSLFFRHSTELHCFSTHAQFDAFFQSTILTAVSTHSIHRTIHLPWTLIIGNCALAAPKEPLKNG